MSLMNKKTRALIVILCTLALSVLVISKIYYKNQDASVDPRITNARSLYEKYNGYAQVNAFDSIFFLMDSIESIYTGYNHYRESYEIGVLYNNRAASYLTMALYSTDLDSIQKDSLIILGEGACRKSIHIYQQWIEKYGDRSETEVELMLDKEFYSSTDNLNPDKRDKYLHNRADEIIEAQAETDRRLSVSYTNLGIIYRYNQQYDSAAISYKTALDLWGKNLTAENNLNVLLNRPQRKRSIIEKLFPSERL